MSTATTSTKPTSTKPSSGWNVGVMVLVGFLVFILFFGIWGTCTDSGRSAFTNIKSKMNIGESSLKNLDIVMFINPECPWCKKMIAVLESEKQINNVNMIDITKKEGIAIAKQFGADKQPVPSFISRKLETGTIGYRDSVSKLIDALKKPSPSSSSEEPEISSKESGGMSNEQIPLLIKNLQIILFTREGCGYCTKAKESCAEAGVMDIIQIVDITTPEGQQLAQEVLPPGTSGVPAWISLATKKHVVGYKPIDQIIQTLQ